MGGGIDGGLRPASQARSDRAQERAARAGERGDHAAYLMAVAQAREAMRRRAEWRPATRSAPSTRVAGEMGRGPLGLSDLTQRVADRMDGILRGHG